MKKKNKNRQKKADRSSEEYDARSERLQEHTRYHTTRAEEEQTTAIRAKQHEDEEDDTGIRPKETGDKQKADRSSE